MGGYYISRKDHKEKTQCAQSDDGVYFTLCELCEKLSELSVKQNIYTASLLPQTVIAPFLVFAPPLKATYG
jgi:hypothetical protein